MFDVINAVILGIVEGVTEFLPVSSTGHLIFTRSMLGIAEGDSFWNMFIVVIQLGAILSVVVYFFKRLWPFGAHKPLDEKMKIWVIWFKALLAVVPALILGALFDDVLEQYLMKPLPVAIALFGWGVIIIITEKVKKRETVDSVNKLTYLQALLIGLIQCLAMVPGTSRSAATIVGAMFLGCSRVAAAEFSFFLAIPTMTAAGAYSLMKNAKIMSAHQYLILAVGCITAFVTAYAVIAVFMRFISKHSFIPFGVYRVILGAAVLAYIFFR